MEEQNSALVGDIDPVSIPLQQDDVEVEEEFTANDKELAAVGNDSKWKVIEDYLDERVAYYKDELGGADVAGLELAKVGEKFVVCSLVAVELQGLKAKVRETTEAVNATRRK